MTPAAQLLEAKLGRNLHLYLAGLIAQHLGWRRIAEQVHADTGVRVSHETLRTWHVAECSTNGCFACAQGLARKSAA